MRMRARVFNWRAFALFVVLDLFLMGIGMGIPVFAIPFGIVVGIYVNRSTKGLSATVSLPRLLRAACVTSLVTFLIAGAIWLPQLAKLSDGSDLGSYGIPLILYGEQASFVGWIVLMVVISPLLQAMVSISAGVIGLVRSYRI